MSTLISVIIPCYNSEKYLEACIQSVLDQSYPHFEIICVDNNSKDTTMGILQRLQKQHPDKIVVDTESKQNASAARMKGLRQAKGSVIQFLDSDDLITKDKFKIQIKRLLETGADVVVSDRVGKDHTLSTILKHHTFEEVEKFPLNTSLAKIIITGNPLYKKTAVEAIEGYDITLRSSQDLDFHIRMALSNASFTYIPGEFLVSRYVPGSLSFDAIKTSYTSCKVLMNLRPQLDKRRVDIQTDSLNRICQIFYDAAIYTPNAGDRKDYIDQLKYWGDKNFQYINSGLKRKIAQFFGLPLVVAIDAWRLRKD